MKRAGSAPVFTFGVLLACCGPVADPRSAEVDLRPPLVQAVQTTGPSEISLQFDESAGLVMEKTRISPSLAITEVKGTGNQVVLRGQEQTPGRLYTLEAEARDQRGNSASFVADFYGFNGSVPALLINEFTPRGSGAHPDIVELKTLSAGDMGGVVLYAGTPDSFDMRFIFPSFQVGTGTFILVHFKPAGDPGEVNETTDMGASTGSDASAHAYDMWVPGGKGLSGNNGVISLYERPGGTCLDGVLYSNRTSQSDERYRGFGDDDMVARAEQLVRDGGWIPAGPRVLPEDGITPEGSTGTRSLCRSPGSRDTDTARDWHIVPTRKASYGADNSNDVYVK